MSYYFPYLYKTHLISLPGDIVDYTIYSTVCSFPFCGYCDTSLCVRCLVGYFLYDGVCGLYCPDGYITDNLRMTCILATTGITTYF